MIIVGLPNKNTRIDEIVVWIVKTDILDQLMIDLSACIIDYK